MVLTEYGGRRVRLQAIGAIGVRAPPIVYNFTVSRTHTYFAGRAKVLVHNASCFADQGLSDRVDSTLERAGRGAERFPGHDNLPFED